MSKSWTFAKYAATSLNIHPKRYHPVAKHGPTFLKRKLPLALQN